MYLVCKRDLLQRLNKKQRTQDQFVILMLYEILKKAKGPKIAAEHEIFGLIDKMYRGHDIRTTCCKTF
ncbi:hypothetical protein B5X24_HaOG208881 [Helicoverpa armigera]|nr:hypothetical protein B5X24_HaOG208881 [Helicoverpa armigera]